MNSQKKVFSFSLVLLLLLFTGSYTLDAQNNRGMTPQQIAELKNVGSVAISDNGNSIAYTLRVQADPLKKNETADYELHMIDTESGESVPYFTDASVSDVQFRPKHNTVTFLAKKEGDQTKSVYEISLRGGEAQKIYSFETSIKGYEWASDGKYLAFMADEPMQEQADPLPYQPEIYEENLAQRRGYIVDTGSDKMKAERVEVEGSIYEMRWSPNRDKLAISVAPTPLIDDFYMKQQVLIIGSRGDKVLGKVDHKGKLGDFVWSPDGKKLAMIAGADIHDPIDGRLFVVSGKGGTPDNIKPGYKGMFEHVAWVDNNTLNYLSSEGVWSEFGTIETDGSNMEAMFKNEGPILESFARSGSGAVAFEANTPEHPDEVYFYDGNKLERLTNSNPWLDEVAMGKQEKVTWEARDGLSLEGILIYPVGYEKDKRYPLVTYIHGGPESHLDNGWVTSYSQTGQVGAARGYAVFYPNYRGSTGRGVEFAKSSQGDPAGAEFDDIVDGIDHLIEEGVADRNKIGATGGSYGGYATGWLSTKYTDRFAAGVMFVGISNNISKWGTSDIPEELYLVHSRERLWKDYDFYLKRSPIYHAGQADTPLLILAGKEDTRVDPGQSYELYRHIKTRTETPVRLVLYPGEGHGNDHATARLDYNLRMLRWFDQYLKGDKGPRPDDELHLEEVGIGN